jgi:precorrin-2 dehydrogenase/sirohydrochlorin ferrochelatase
VAALFPLFLKLKKHKCLMVGAGKIGEGKIAGLLEAGANVHVVAPSVTKRVKDWNRQGKVRWSRREFRESDLEGCLLVVAATPSSELHKKISRLARRHGVLCNVVDVPDLCDFYYPAVVRRGALQIAISTGGESPALAQRLRRRLQGEFGIEYSEWLQKLGEERRKLRRMSTDAFDRKSLLHSMASEEAFQAFMRKHVGKTNRRQPE